MKATIRTDSRLILHVSGHNPIICTVFALFCCDRWLRYSNYLLFPSIRSPSVATFETRYDFGAAHLGVDRVAFQDRLSVSILEQVWCTLGGAH